MRPTTTIQRHFRRGTITVIVVAFLTLLAVVGLTFLIASQNYSTSSQKRRDHENREDEPVPTEIINSVFGDIIYDTRDHDFNNPDSAAGAFSAVRGHGLGRLVYGLNPNPGVGGGNTIPYSGIGRARGNTNFQMASMGFTDDYYAVSYVWHPGDGFVRDPERYCSSPTVYARPNPMYSPLLSYPPNAAVPTGLPAVGTDPTGVNSAVYFPANANYTFPDLNNLALAVVDWNTGEVLLPSYHRPEAFGLGSPAIDKWKLAPPLNPDGTVNPQGNTNWVSPAGKYLMLRPRPNEHPNFPYPKLNANGTYGDVENLLGKSIGQQYDSLWLDFDLPVKTWRGKQYKPMVALLVTDLDGRVNINTAGNLRARNFSHGANQGWGPHEVHLGAALGNDNEAAQVLNGNPSVPSVNGRYWNANFAAANPTLPRGARKRFTTHAIVNPMAPDYDLDTMGDQSPAPGYGPHFYSQVDFDGGAVSATPARWNKPTVKPNMFEQFAVWGPPPPTPMPPAIPPGTLDPNNRYWNGGQDALTGTSERILHPSLFNPYLYKPKQSPSNASEPRAFGVQELSYLSRRFTESTQQLYLQTPLGQLAPTSLGGNGPLSSAVRNRVTTMSNDFDRPGATAWMTAANSLPPTLNAGQLAPQYPPAPTQPYALSATTGFDTDTTYRALIGVLGAVDINRPLTDYRGNLSQAYTQATLANAPRAIADRQRLAADIYARICAAVGVPNILTYANTPQGNAKRWYAQLAVNIVDYIDNDDYITPFRWTQADGGAVSYPADNLTDQTTVQQNYVFGTELPRLAINEVFVRYENDPNDPGLSMAMNRRAQSDYLAKYWIELHNPLTPANQTQIGSLSDQGNAKLTTNGGNSVYQLVLVRPDGAAPYDSSLRAPDNPDGRPVPAQVLNVIQFTGVTAPNDVVAPNIGAQYGPNRSFYLVGSEATFPDATAMGGTPTAANFTAATLQTVVPRFDPDMPANVPQASCPTILLQRLLNPHQEPSQQNPYITVDYFMTQPAMFNDHLILTTATDRMMPKDWNTASSYGRRQPLQGTMLPANLANYRQQPNMAVDNTALPMTNYAMHTLGRHNGKDKNGTINAMGDTLDSPFDWPVHLDRAVVSPAELTHVSAFKPHEFTQQFAKGALPSAPFGHNANWFSDTTRLYKVLDLLHVPTRLHGLGSGGRVPGKININTLYDQNVFNAVTNRATAGTANYFSQADIDAAWQRLNTYRFGTPLPPSTATQWTGVEKPYHSSLMPLVAAGGQYPAGLNGANTAVGPFLYSNPIPAAIDHPYKGTELLQTVMNNFTTRSNCFAVYATIGYFEVERFQPYSVQSPTGTNYTINRPVLGRELVTETGSVTRHRFFAVIDRTNLSTVNGEQGAKPVYFSYEPVVPLTSQVYTPDPQPSGGPVLATVAIPATSFDPSGTGTGYGHYDGIDWRISVGSQLLIDYNPSSGTGFGAVSPATLMVPETTVSAQRNRTEFVTVTGVSNDLANGRILVQFPINKPHARGTNILLLNPSQQYGPAIPGNPGPQPKFNYLSENYRAVIPHVEQIE